MQTSSLLIKRFIGSAGGSHIKDQQLITAPLLRLTPSLSSLLFIPFLRFILIFFYSLSLDVHVQNMNRVVKALSAHSHISLLMASLHKWTQVARQAGALFI